VAHELVTGTEPAKPESAKDRKDREELTKQRDALNLELLALAEKMSELDQAADMVGAIKE
jgi:hypothetical protein